MNVVCQFFQRFDHESDGVVGPEKVFCADLFGSKDKTGVYFFAKHHCMDEPGVVDDAEVAMKHEETFLKLFGHSGFRCI